MEKNKNVQFVDIGHVAYKETWDFQEALLAFVSNIKLDNRGRTADEMTPTPNYLLFCEHPHVYTLGKSGNEGHLLLQPAFLEQIGASYFKINRGGDITYHGPGQLVGYPILDLENFTTDIHLYLRTLEEVIIQSCQHFGLHAGRVDNLTGVWIDPDSPQKRKICAMGVKASRWITMHGFALNLNTDLSYFQHIVPCGIQEYGVTSLAKELGHSVDEKLVKDLVLQKMQQLFEMEIVNVSRETLERSLS
ncbi:MAG: Lipoyl(octanoyl) transferase [Bacteroidota bacterium]|jgi:lipoyl(octanoyl) transferase